MSVYLLLSLLLGRRTCRGCGAVFICGGGEAKTTDGGWPGGKAAYRERGRGKCSHVQRFMASSQVFLEAKSGSCDWFLPVSVQGKGRGGGQRGVLL